MDTPTPSSPLDPITALCQLAASVAGDPPATVVAVLEWSDGRLEVRAYGLDADSRYAVASLSAGVADLNAKRLANRP